MMNTPHVDDRLDDWLDDRLEPAERAEIERHLRDCEDCRGLADGLVATRRVLRASSAEATESDGLAARIRLALDREDEAAGAVQLGTGMDLEAETEPQSERSDASEVSEVSEASGLAPIVPFRHRMDRRTWALAAVALFATFLGLGVWLTPSSAPPSIPTPDPTPKPTVASPVDDAFHQYAAIDGTESTKTRLAVESPEELHGRWQDADLGFEARVLDLRAMGIELAGGDAPRLGGRKSALAVYSSDGNPPVACWMFRGTEAELPEPIAEHHERGFHFRLYEREGVTLVVWREGDVLCILASRGPRSDVLSLAVGKAMAPPARV